MKRCGLCGCGNLKRAGRTGLNDHVLSIAGLYPHKCGYCRQRTYLLVWMHCITPVICLATMMVGAVSGVYALKARSGAPYGGGPKRALAEKIKSPMGKWATFEGTAVIDNQALMSLSQTSLSARTLVKVIERSPCHFDVSPKAVIRMKESGVAEEVIYAMLANLDQCGSDPAPTAVPAQSHDNVSASIVTDLVAPVQ